MRIISGRFKGRSLVSFKASHIRPTTDRVKESLFNKIQGLVDGARVLDLFSGTGSLGLEALSRGAAYVEFVDDAAASLNILKKNLKLLGVEKGFTLKKSDALRYLSSFAGEPFDLILIDPPFTKQMAHSVLETLSASKVWDDRSWIAIETVRGEHVEKHYGLLTEFDEKYYGDKSLRWFARQGEE